MRVKKSQFYIIMSAIIAVVLTGLIAIVNYVIVKPEPIQFYDLSKQLESEVNRVIDYATYNNKDVASAVDDYVQSFLKYAQEKDPQLGLIYVYGNSTYLIVVNYGKNDSGVFFANRSVPLYGSEAQQVSQIRMDIGSAQIGKKIVEEKGIFQKIRETFYPGQNKVIVINVADKFYNFALRGQQYFFAVVKSEKENETYYSCTPSCY